MPEAPPSPRFRGAEPDAGGGGQGRVGGDALLRCARPAGRPRRRTGGEESTAALTLPPQPLRPQARSRGCRRRPSATPWTQSATACRRTASRGRRRCTPGRGTASPRWRATRGSGVSSRRAQPRQAPQALAFPSVAAERPTPGWRQASAPSLRVSSRACTGVGAEHAAGAAGGGGPVHVVRPAQAPPGPRGVTLRSGIRGAAVWARRRAGAHRAAGRTGGDDGPRTHQPAGSSSSRNKQRRHAGAARRRATAAPGSA